MGPVRVWEEIICFYGMFNSTFVKCVGVTSGRRIKYVNLASIFFLKKERMHSLFERCNNTQLTNSSEKFSSFAPTC